MELIIAIIGWSGAFLTLLAYGLLTRGRLQGQSRIYLLMNIAGAVGFIINSGWNRAYPSVALNTISLAIGLYALVGGEARVATKNE
jgi:hypothetical protein